MLQKYSCEGCWRYMANPVIWQSLKFGRAFGSLARNSRSSTSCSRHARMAARPVLCWCHAAREPLCAMGTAAHRKKSVLKKDSPKLSKMLERTPSKIVRALAKTNCSTAPQMFSWDVTPLFSVNLESHLSGRFWGWTFWAVWKIEAWPWHRQLWPQKSRAVHGWRVANGWIDSRLASRDMMS